MFILLISVTALRVTLYMQGGAQFYIACAQVSVTGGSGSKSPSDLVSFPGAYSPDDPGLLVDIYDAGDKE